MTTLVGACVISVLPWKCVTVRGKTSSPWPEPMPSGMPVGTEDVGGAELLPSPAAPAAEEAESAEPPFLEAQEARIGAIAARPARDRVERRL